MKRFSVLCILFSLCLSVSCQERFSPWGIWNDMPLHKSARIVETKYGSFYQNGFNGVWILEDLQELFPHEEKISALVNWGEYTQITSYTEVQDGIVFVIRERRTKDDPDTGAPLFEYFDTELKMEFLSKNTCRFTYLNHEEIKGFEFGSFGNNVKEDLIYERVPVVEKSTESDSDE